MVRATLMEVIWIEENRGSGGHFHGGQGDNIQVKSKPRETDTFMELKKEKESNAQRKG